MSAVSVPEPGGQVSWFEVHEFVSPWLQSAGRYPLIGTPLWVELDDRDRAKWAAIISAAEHMALVWESKQIAMVEAADVIRPLAPWSEIVAKVQQREAFRDAHPDWARRRNAG